MIVTSYVFRDGKLDFENLAKLEKEVGKKRIVLGTELPEARGFLLYRDGSLAEIYRCETGYRTLGDALGSLQ